MNALSDAKVGEVVGSHFVAAYKKVGTFRKDGAAKNGGNVAAYFCTPDGSVIHTVPGPVTADVFLREARWAVDVYESAVMEHKGDADGQREYLKLAHALRYMNERRGGDQLARKGNGIGLVKRINNLMPKSMPTGVGPLGQAHWLLWSNPMPPLADVYQTVWTDILNEQVTDLPVIGR